MIKEYNINDYLKDDKELQKSVIQELLEEMKNEVAKNKELTCKLTWCKIALESEQEERKKFEQTLIDIREIAERFKYSDREEEQKLLCFKNDMLNIIYRVNEVLKIE